MKFKKVGSVYARELKDGSTRWASTIERDKEAFRRSFDVEELGYAYNLGVDDCFERFMEIATVPPLPEDYNFSRNPKDDNCLSSRVIALEENYKLGAKELADQREKILKIAKLFKQL